MSGSDSETAEVTRRAASPPAANATKQPPAAKTAAYKRTARSKVKRRPKRGFYDHATVHAILDAGVIAHIGYVIDGQPFVTPTAYWRDGDRLYWHGSAASRMLRSQSAGLPVCLTVTHLDGLVVARSGFNHSINYRSVLAFGTAYLVDDPAEKTAALRAFLERLYPGRWAQLRPPTRQEMKSTSVLGMKIDEASAKIRSDPPHDDPPDYAAACWAGVVPITTVVGALQPDPLLVPARPPTADLDAYAAGAAFDGILSRQAEPAADR